MEIGLFGTDGIVDLSQLMIFPQNMVIIGLLLLFPLTFVWRSSVCALRRLYNSRQSQLAERVASLFEEKYDSLAKITEQNVTMRLQGQLNMCMHSKHCLQQENDEMKVTIKLFGEENENMRDKVKILKKRLSEEEQKITERNSQMALLEKELLQKTMKICTLERALEAERADIVRLRQRLVEITDLLVLLKKSRLETLPRSASVDHHRSRCQKYSNSAIIKDILHELVKNASEEIRISADSNTRTG
ncbi:uncharacterized protein LOC121697018 isoform X3 [Alosa sapidissima]|uniref:uncharacterized protein LOC121697018 isoform X3 n=1 Tax=Alosa sapidissima TaxID=34773 RepID=UPI001C097BF6|nr:uncharacterized protein LOC121697018 isoform X3 [Alosa sapidissima]